MASGAGPLPASASTPPSKGLSTPPDELSTPLRDAAARALETVDEDSAAIKIDSPKDSLAKYDSPPPKYNTPKLDYSLDRESSNDSGAALLNVYIAGNRRTSTGSDASSAALLNKHVAGSPRPAGYRASAASSAGISSVGSDKELLSPASKQRANSASGGSLRSSQRVAIAVQSSAAHKREKSRSKDKDIDSSDSDVEGQCGSADLRSHMTQPRVIMLAVAALLAGAGAVALQVLHRPASERPVLWELGKNGEMVREKEPSGPACTDEDMVVLGGLAASNDLHGGGDAQAFFSATGTCGRSSVGLGLGLTWHDESWISCMRDEYPSLSPTCLSCYNGNGKYGLENCAGKCLISWCSEDCLTCGDGYRDLLSSCIGRSGYPLPKPQKCCPSSWGAWTPDAC